MYRAFRHLGVAALFAASTAHPQSPEAAMLNHTWTGYGVAREFGSSNARIGMASPITVAGERALLGRVESHAGPTESTDLPDTPMDGARALLGRWHSAATADADRTPRQSSFLAEVRGDVIASASGDAEFGFIPTADSSAGFTLSLGARGGESAILFTRRSGAPLAVGRYRISEGGNGPDEILALVVTGSPTKPTGVFRGRSGWLVVTAASDRALTGRFQVDGVGFLASEAEMENRPVQATGSFSAASSL